MKVDPYPCSWEVIDSSKFRLKGIGYQNITSSESYTISNWSSASSQTRPEYGMFLATGGTRARVSYYSGDNYKAISWGNDVQGGRSRTLDSPYIWPNILGATYYRTPVMESAGGIRFLVPTADLPDTLTIPLNIGGISSFSAVAESGTYTTHYITMNITITPLVLTLYKQETKGDGLSYDASPGTSASRIRMNVNASASYYSNYPNPWERIDAPLDLIGIIVKPQGLILDDGNYSMEELLELGFTTTLRKDCWDAYYGKPPKDSYYIWGNLAPKYRW